MVSKKSTIHRKNIDEEYDNYRDEGKLTAVESNLWMNWPDLLDMVKDVKDSKDNF